MLFDDSWKQFTNILVTGPQRSGTRLCSKIISYDLGYNYIDEVLFSVNHEHSFKELLSKKKYHVFQCPGMSHIIEQFSTPETAIIFMLRPTLEIIASQERIKWVATAEINHYSEYEGPICERKLRKWITVQKEKCHHPFMILYKNLRSHKLWIPKEKRVNFTWKQTSL